MLRFPIKISSIKSMEMGRLMKMLRKSIKGSPGIRRKAIANRKHAVGLARQK